MERRRFNQMLSLSCVAAVSCVGTKKAGIKNNDMIPKKLNPGARVGLIAPASAASSIKIEAAIRNIEQLGLVVVEGEYLHSQEGFLAASDENRLKDFHRMFADPSIDAIWCVRGGYGASRLLEDLDYDLIKANPKILLGYSDITAFLNAIYLKTGLISYHGPVASSELTEYALPYIKSTFFEDSYLKTLLPVEKTIGDAESYQVLRSGKATGRLLGGNLSLLSAMCGTGYLPDFEGNIVFIEEVGERPYRVDRMMVQMLQSTHLSKAAAIVFGQFTDCTTSAESQTVEEVILDSIASFDGPVVYGYSIGHVANQCVLPVGQKATLDTEKRSITLL